MNPHATIWYDVDLTDARETRSFLLRFSSCISVDQGLLPFRSQAWKCRLPDPNIYIEDPFGTSETRGIVGGVNQPVLAAQSEAIERALGDALVLSFAQVFDLMPSVSVVLVRGPAFPKTVGRFLSMRPSRRVTVAWVMSLNDSRTHPLPLLVPLTWYEERSMAWDSEALINSFTHPETDPAWAVEFLNIGDSADAVTAIREVLDNYKTSDIGQPRDIWCAEQLLRPESMSDFVFTEESKQPYPSWMTKALTGGPVGSPKEFIGRNLMIFPWQDVDASN
jgi:hypothetical protein